MSLARFTRYIISATLIALVYIHMQMQIIDLAYQGQRKETQIKDLTDKNGHAFYAIARLKSANHLGQKMLAEKSSMQFAGANDIVRVATPDGKESRPGADYPLQAKKKTGALLSLLSLTTQAEARNR